MGVVRRQTIKNNLLSYFGVAIGVVSQLYIYPLSLETKGLADGLIRFATLLYPFFTLGVGAVMVRFLPYMRAERSVATARLLTQALRIVSVAVLGLLVVGGFFGEPLINWVTAADYHLGMLESHRWSVLLVTTCLVYAGVFTTNLINYRRIAVPVVFNNLLLKVSLPLLVLAVTYRFITLQQYLLGIIGTYLLIVGGLIIYSQAIGALKFDSGPLLLKGKTFSDMTSTAGYALFGLLGSSLVTNMDVVMVNTFLNNVETAIYSFCLFAAGVMAIPYAAVNTITAPTVAERWQSGDRAGLGRLYRDSSIALSAVGALVIAGLAVCLPYLYLITENMAQHAPGYWPTLIVAGAIFADQVTGINSTLINYTDYYRWHIVFVLLAGVLNFVLNYYFLVVLQAGITGAAAATMTSLVLYNLAKSVFVWLRIGIQPLSRDHISILVVFFLLGLAAFALPPLGSVWVELLIRGSLIAGGGFLVFRFTSASVFLQRALKEGLRSVF